MGFDGLVMVVVVGAMCVAQEEQGLTQPLCLQSRLPPSKFRFFPRYKIFKRKY